MDSKKEPIQYIEEDEISLTEIIKTIIKRKKLFFSVSIIAFLIPMSYGIYKEIQIYKNSSNPDLQKLQYTSYLAVGFRSANVLIEPLETIKLIIEEVYYPESGLDHPIAVESNWTKMGNTVKIVSILSESDKVTSQEIKKQHEYILSKILERHNKLYNEMLGNNPSNFTSQSYASSSRVVSTAKEVLLRPEPDHKKFVMVLLVGFFFALIAGVVSVFLYEFVLNLKRELGE